jgi:hypothetical protein
MAVTVNNVNEAPTDITFTGTGVDEDAAAGTIVETLGATDPDASSTFTYALVAGDGTNDADNALVQIAINEIHVAAGAVIDYETNPVLHLNLLVTDGHDLVVLRAASASRRR